MSFKSPKVRCNFCFARVTGDFQVAASLQESSLAPLPYCIFKYRPYVQNRIPCYFFVLFTLKHSLYSAEKNQKARTRYSEEVTRACMITVNWPLYWLRTLDATCFDWHSAYLFVHQRMRPSPSAAHAVNCSNAKNSDVLKLRGFAWNYSTIRYGIVSNNRSYSTNASKKIFDNLAPFIFAGYITNTWTVHCLSLSWSQGFTGCYI